MYNALAQCPVRGRHPTTISVIPFLAGHSRVLYSRTWLLVARGEPGTFFSGGGRIIKVWERLWEPEAHTGLMRGEDSEPPEPAPRRWSVAETHGAGVLQQHSVGRTQERFSGSQSSASHSPHATWIAFVLEFTISPFLAGLLCGWLLHRGEHGLCANRSAPWFMSERERENEFSGERVRTV